MSGPCLAGGDVSSGTYTCTACRFKLHVAMSQHLPRCPSCGGEDFHTASGAEVAADESCRSRHPR